MTQIELLPCPFCGCSATYVVGPSSVRNFAHYVMCNDCTNTTCMCATTDEAASKWNTRTPSPTRSDTREQAAASPSAVGEGLLTELLRRAYRFVQSDNEFTERDWTEYENTKDEIRAVLSGQFPLRDALQTMIASAEVYTEGDEVTGYRIKTGALHRVIGMLGLTIPAGLPIAAEANTAKDDMCPNCVSPYKCNGPHIGEHPPHGYETPDRLAPIGARGVVTDAEIHAALYARVPGGAQVREWLPDNRDGTPHETAKDVMRSALKAFVTLRARESAPAVEK